MKITREVAKELLPIVKALAEGKMIQDKIEGVTGWVNTDEINLEFEGQKILHRIKPEPKYRPFKTKEECWNEMLKHQPLGWCRDKEGGALLIVTAICDQYIYFDGNPTEIDKTFDIYEFLDGTPFGINEE